MADIVILGAGGWGTALAVMADGQGHRITIWSPFEAEIQSLIRTRRQPKLLPGIVIPETVEFTSNISCAATADLVIVATPSFAVRDTAKLLSGVIPVKTALIACVSKGVEKDTYLRLSQVISQELPHARVVVLSGPSHAEEVARGIPTSIVSASTELEAAQEVQELLMNETLRIYTNDDVIGVELGAALKNIIALAAGVIDGLGLGDNTKAMLITRGLSEMARLGVAMGARKDTFAGLSGIGDLVVTCTSIHSRNRRFGVLIGQLVSVEDAIRQVGMTVEGYHATKTAYELAQKYEVPMPIVQEAYRVLYQNADPRDAICRLMTRPKRNETEHPF